MKMNRIYVLVVGCVNVFYCQAVTQRVPSLAALCTRYAAEHEREIAHHVPDGATYLPDMLNARIENERIQTLAHLFAIGSLRKVRCALNEMIFPQREDLATAFKILARRGSYEALLITKHLVKRQRIERSLLRRLFEGEPVSQCFASYLSKRNVACELKKTSPKGNLFEIGVN